MDKLKPTDSVDRIIEVLDPDFDTFMAQHPDEELIEGGYCTVCDQRRKHCECGEDPDAYAEFADRELEF